MALHVRSWAVQQKTNYLSRKHISFFNCCFFFLVDVELIYNVLVSGVQQWFSHTCVIGYTCVQSVTYAWARTYIHIIFFIFFSIIGYYKILNTVLCAIHRSLLFILYIVVCISEKAMAPHSSTLAWKIHGQRSLVGCSPWGP